jgi:hypothetical protein|tara:strand:+ start:1015 stop:1224 length:210 start_codon:yes stop_codon:yes gene_type:complete
MDKDILDSLHDSVAKELLARVRSGEATSAELSVATKFLKDNGAVHDVVTTESPMGNLLEALPFAPEASH